MPSVLVGAPHHLCAAFDHLACCLRAHSPAAMTYRFSPRSSLKLPYLCTC